jgi:hypothetical protein
MSDQAERTPGLTSTTALRDGQPGSALLGDWMVA